MSFQKESEEFIWMNPLNEKIFSQHSLLKTEFENFRRYASQAFEAFNKALTNDRKRILRLERIVVHCERPVRRSRLAFTIDLENDMTITSVTGAHMSLTLSVGPVSAFVQPIDSNGVLTQATLSNVTFQSSDTTVATVANDPADGAGVIVTAIGPGSVAILADATASEADGSSEDIGGELDITFTAIVNPTLPSASLQFTVTSPAQAAPVASGIVAVGAQLRASAVRGATQLDPNTPAGRRALALKK